MKKVTYDFETRSRVNLKRCGAYEYSIDPSTVATCLAFKKLNEPKVHLLDFHQMQKPWAEQPESLKKYWTQLIAEEYLFNSHNHYFETCIYDNVLVARLGWPEIPFHLKRCTAGKAAAVAIPRNLADAGAVMALSVQKDFEGHRVMMKLCKPTAAYTKWKKQYDKFIARGQEDLADAMIDEGAPDEFYTPETAPEDFEKLYKYCKIDVLAEEKLDASLPDLNEFEQELWLLDQKINWRGVQVDMPVVNKISSIMAKESKTMGKELDVLTMGLVSSGNARNQILEFLMLEDIELPDLKAKTVDDFLKNGKVTGDAKKLLEIRRALSKASTAKYQKFIYCASSDGRARDLFLYHGASTGRWGGKNVQPQNFPRGVIKDIDEAIDRIKTCSTDELKLLYGENLMPLFSSVLRGMFIASPGHQLFVEDLNAIETRVLWWLADHTEGLEMFHKGEDPYKHQAAAIFKKSILQITDDERQVGKAAVLGCGYQMGGKKFQTSAWDVYRAKVDLDLAKVAVTSYRELHWPVTELWEKYNSSAIWAVENPGKAYRVGKVRFFCKNNFLWIELPSGRRLAYKDPSVSFEKTIVMTGIGLDGEGDTIYAASAEMYRDAIDRGYKKSGEFQSKRLKYFAVNHKAKKVDCVIPKWTREASYGGKLAENIVQAVARDVLAEAIVRAEKRGFQVLMHSHDEMVSEAPLFKFELTRDSKGVLYCPEYRKIMETVPAWGEGLPLKSGGWVGPRYRKG